MNTKYFSVSFDLKKINRLVRKYTEGDDYYDLKFNNEKEFLELLAEVFSDESDYEGSDWRFTFLSDFNVIKVTMENLDFSEFKNIDDAFEKFVKNYLVEGINLGSFLGLLGQQTTINGEVSNLPRIGHDWKYKEITGPALLLLKKKESV